ncbi:tetratricopeptide repeat protein [Shewanella intestini]|uniref:Sel1 repeat family protein n=1 Tax=Shewanella intestini TaxID=2017544 RepID=A0ABS5I0U6_9GAMM|nr:MULTISPECIES: SEL1-like repeat protein [Shewanella]MBR9727643.1 sel1 repeat family protein [Shewanella intestini]MRG35207.1 flagellar protein MotX [Shewanella sp. XMDDZSB0408]
MLRILILLILLLPHYAFCEDTGGEGEDAVEAYDIYGDEVLTQLIRNNQYLQRVKADECQLVQDIEARAEVLKQPLYQFLWGEMLNTGTCVDKHVSRGMGLLQTAAEQGSSEAMVKLAEYYNAGKLVIGDKNRAVQYVLPAAANGNLTARLMLVRLFNEGYGSPRDYELVYHWLYHSYFNDSKQHKEAISLLRILATKMPASIVNRAQKKLIHTQ